MKKKIFFLGTIAIAVMNVVFGIGTVVLSLMNGTDWPTILSDGSWMLCLSMTSIGILIALFRKHNPMGWILLGIGFSQGLVSFALQYGTYVLITYPGAFPGGELMSWLGQIVWFPGLSLMLTYAILLFPSGHLPSPRWRIFAWLCVFPLLLFIPVAISIWPYRGLDLLLNPDQTTPTSGFLYILLQLSFPMLLLCGLVCLVSIFIRFHHANQLERRQIKWVAFAASIFMVIELLQSIEPIYSFFNDNKLIYLIALPVSIALPAAIGIAVLRYRLWEIDILINRTLVYVPLTAILSGLYAASISLLQKMFIAFTGTKSDGAVVLTTLILTATFTPIKNAIQSFVDRRFKTPLEPLSTLKAFKSHIQSIEEVVNRESAARRFLDNSVSALQSSCGAVFLAHEGTSQIVSFSGDWEAGRETLTIPIGKETGSVGTLYLGPRRDGTAYTEAEVFLLSGVAESLWRVLGNQMKQNELLKIKT